MRPDETARTSVLRRMPRSVWVLGFVSLLMDVSSEMTHALLPVWMVVGLGASTLAVGMIEGIAEATASIVKVFSGVISDRIGHRKRLAVIGYGLAALTKPIFPLAGSLGWIVAARFVDRIGKGIRGAPRDALVADVAPDDLRGAAFGLRQSLDTVGAFAGPLVAVVLMAASGDAYRLVFWVAVAPALVAVLLLVFAVAEPAPKPGSAARQPPTWAETLALPRACRRVVAIATVFTLARFSEAFLVLRAQSIGLSAVWIPLVMVAMNVAYALCAFPVGALSDRIGRVGLLRIGLALLVVADLVLAAANNVATLMIGAVVWGLHMGFTQGLFATMVADTAPARLRGTAFGVFNLVTGAALFLASLLAGALWDVWGAEATFLAGALFAVTTFALLGRGRLAPT